MHKENFVAKMQNFQIGWYIQQLMTVLFLMIEHGLIKMKIENLIHMNRVDLMKLRNGEIHFSRNILFKKFYGGTNFLIHKMMINCLKKMKLYEVKIWF